VTFHVQKSLAHGPIRFGVSPRQTLEQIDGDAALSTGGSGEFLRRRTQGFFFADSKPVGAPSLPATPSISRTPFWESLRGEGPAGIGFVALLILGAIFVLLGFAVVVRKGAAGWVEVILGTVMIATPIVLTAKKRGQIAAQEEKERAEREERERKQRAMLDAYTAALKRLRDDPSDANLESMAREREGLELPYEIWSPVAKRTVLQIGFNALARFKPSGSKQVADLMTRAATAVGLSAANAQEVKLDLYRILVWHLIADDRLGDVQSGQLKLFRQGFDMADRDVPVEAQVAEEFRKLQGIDKSKVPRVQCAIKLGFREYCVQSTRGMLFNEKGHARGAGSLFVTNKRVLIDVKKPIEIPLAQIDDVEVNVDANLLTIRAAKPDKPVIMQVEQPIYTAAIIDIATSIDDRPRGFA
jgi:hypothetical protein